MNATQNVTVVGPNLRGEKGEMVVHAAGCADLTKVYRRNVGAEAGAWTFEADSLLQIAGEVYDFIEDPEDAMSSFWFAPCITIPRSAEA